MNTAKGCSHTLYLYDVCSSVITFGCVHSMYQLFLNLFSLGAGKSAGCLSCSFWHASWISPLSWIATGLSRPFILHGAGSMYWLYIDDSGDLWPSSGATITAISTHCVLLTRFSGDSVHFPVWMEASLLAFVMLSWWQMPIQTKQRAAIHAALPIYVCHCWLTSLNCNSVGAIKFIFLPSFRCSCICCHVN